MTLKTREAGKFWTSHCLSSQPTHIGNWKVLFLSYFLYSRTFLSSRAQRWNKAKNRAKLEVEEKSREGRIHTTKQAKAKAVLKLLPRSFRPSSWCVCDVNWIHSEREKKWKKFCKASTSSAEEKKKTLLKNRRAQKKYSCFVLMCAVYWLPWLC